MALMAAVGEITPMPDCAIFADTKAEPQAVYEWLGWLEQHLPFPVIRVTQGNLAQAIGKKPNGRYDYMPLPAFVQGKDGRASLLNRSCTRDFKLTPIRREVRRQLALTGKRSPRHPVVTQWIGVSLDEVQRAKPPRERWVMHRWPLLERGMTRMHCIDWMAAKWQRVPPRSACSFCPFHDDAEWVALKNDPAAWAEAVEMDRRIRNMRGGQRTTPVTFLHRSMKPLPEVEFKPGESDSQDEFGFPVECEGMCGV